MCNQCLDVQQMQHLQEMGLDTNNASMCWLKTPNGRDLTFNDEWINLDESILDPVPAYTLQDVLDALPASIEHGGKLYMLMIDMLNRTIHYFRYTEVLTFVKFKEIPFIDAAYNLLCWAIEQGYVETNKNK